jgi:sucrose-6-phosphate hydrolase SacC (GH32 family)
LKQSVPAENANTECVSGIKGDIIQVTNLIVLAVMQVNRTLSSLENPVNVNPILYVPYDTTARLQVQIYVDHSIIEVFINGGKYCITTRIYPSTPAPDQHVEVFANGGSIQFMAHVYTMNGVW